ncbi:hypothetical protein SCHPADRAFT_947566 [Schizopora paradoxa]|uniref:Uncharacterized protein n=1 Tax=Schizopora paradoxa TaxID=27342 RepID=A0A0H2R050_9AGAM|nr:hypothetical protein SCHPADRAFT_947566 [Schizopora paradoxa]
MSSNLICPLDGLTEQAYVDELSAKRRAGRKRTNNLSEAQKKAIAEKVVAKKTGLHGSLAAEWERRGEAAAQIALEHNMKVEEIVKRLNHGSGFKAHREVSAYNAFLHFTGGKLNAELVEAGGAGVNVIELQAKMKEIGVYEKLPEEMKKQMVAVLAAHRKATESKGTTAVKGRLQDIAFTFKNVSKELSDLQARCQTSALLVLTRCSADAVGAPYTYADPSAERFVEVGLESSMQGLATNLEAYAISGLKGAARNDNDRRNSLKKCIRESLKTSLHEITGTKDAKMCWNKYDFEKKIVLAYGVDLVGWPMDTIFVDVGKLSASVLEKCKNALESGDCKWVKLNRSELQNRVSQSNELEKPARKTRSDKRSRQKKEDSIDSSDSEGGSRKRRRRSGSIDGHDSESDAVPRPRVCSAPTIVDSDVE